MKENEEQFDEKMIEALGKLFEQFWILREEEPDVYQFIRERDQKLKRYIQEKFGLELTIHQYFIKLEKIPVEPQSWMGIQALQSQMDYALFCCVLAYMEQKAVEEQFLLSDLAEQVQEFYPGEFPLDWTRYQHRRSLVRVLKAILSLRLLKTIDGHLELFKENEEEEVLYEATVYSRYFMRSYPDNLFLYHSINDLLEQEWKRQPDDRRRKRVYRKLMMMPFVYRQEEDDPDFAYIRNYRNRLREDFEQHTPFRLEVFKNVAMLTLDESKQKYTLYPDRKSIYDVTLHTMATLRTMVDTLEITELGTVRMPRSQLNQVVSLTKEQYGSGWSKQHREETIEETTKQVITLWQDWNMAWWDEEMRIVTILPGAARLIARYPKDYEESRRSKGGG